MGALAVFITVIIPRMIFASVALLESWRLQRKSSVPPEICDYARETYGLGSGGVALPYGLCSYDCSPSESFIEWVEAGSNRLFGRAGVIAVGPSFARGEEAKIASAIAQTMGEVAGLCRDDGLRADGVSQAPWQTHCDGVSASSQGKKATTGSART